MSSITAERHGKLSRQLDCPASTEDACAFSLSQPAAEAVIVSRLGLKTLRRIRGPLDAERLERYIAWAARPETLTLHRPRRGLLRLRADLGPDSVILLRHDFAGPWRV